jgi:glycosyltransferase involved in cell wall biosynthesis
MLTDAVQTPRVARYYHTARTAHLERLASQTPAWFYYSTVRADFDPEMARKNPLVNRASALKVAVDVVRKRIEILEVPEPLAVALWPQLVLIHTLVFCSRFVTRSRVRVVSYAIENYPTDRKLTEFSKLPRALSTLVVKLVAGYLIRTSHKIVFGTADAEATYARLLGGAMRRSNLSTRLVWALPAAENFDDGPRPQRVAFLGTFEERKGIVRLMEAWSSVGSLVPGAELVIMGKSGLIEEVREFVDATPSVRLIEDPPRTQIFDELRTSKTLVLFSQPSRGWKEQVGLPIVEALSLGCEIVASDETGIARWLDDSGHWVLPASASSSELAAAIAGSLLSSRTPKSIVRALPREDGRTLADRELFGSSATHTASGSQ